MARTFVSASANYLQASSTPVTGAPLTMACWFQRASAASFDVFTLNQAGTNNEGFRLLISTTQMVASARAGSIENQSAIASVPSTNTWCHYAGVFASSTSRTVYKDGVAGTTNTGSATPASLNRVTLGAFVGSTTVNPLNGDAAEFGLWNVALTAEDIATLADGVSPLLVRPDALVGYWPVMGRTSPEVDIIGERHATLSGTPAQAAHPPMRYPGQVQAWKYAAAGGGGSTAVPVFYRHYQSQRMAA